jgi:hypothetical protein
MPVEKELKEYSLRKCVLSNSRVSLEPRAEEPTHAGGQPIRAGATYYNTVEREPYYYDGEMWVPFDSGEVSGDFQFLTVEEQLDAPNLSVFGADLDAADVAVDIQASGTVDGTWHVDGAVSTSTSVQTPSLSGGALTVASTSGDLSFTVPDGESLHVSIGAGAWDVDFTGAETAEASTVFSVDAVQVLGLVNFDSGASTQVHVFGDLEVDGSASCEDLSVGGAPQIAYLASNDEEVDLLISIGSAATWTYVGSPPRFCAIRMGNVVRFQLSKDLVGQFDGVVEISGVRMGYPSDMVVTASESSAGEAVYSTSTDPTRTTAAVTYGVGQASGTGGTGIEIDVTIPAGAILTIHSITAWSYLISDA